MKTKEDLAGRTWEYTFGYINCRDDVLELIEGHKKCMNELCYKELKKRIVGEDLIARQSEVEVKDGK
jgi:hypothetical protein